jgi:hypothetical protein
VLIEINDLITTDKKPCNLSSSGSLEGFGLEEANNCNEED